MTDLPPHGNRTVNSELVLIYPVTVMKYNMLYTLYNFFFFRLNAIRTVYVFIIVYRLSAMWYLKILSNNKYLIINTSGKKYKFNFNRAQATKGYCSFIEVY